MTGVAELIADPHFLLHRIDPQAGVATFVPTTKDQLSIASFLDGRTDFSSGPPVIVSLDAVLAHGPPPSPGPDRMIFHVAFCGSTLLARLIEQDGAAHVLKEPDVLVDLANWQRGGTDARFVPALDMARACLRRRWSPAEAVVVKPTNWINNLLPDLTNAPDGLKAVYIIMDRRAYVTAVLRGGRDRLAFTARTAAHLAPSLAPGPGWLAAAIAASADPIGRAINLALVALHVQQRLFGEAGAAALDFETIVTQPVAAAQRASGLLDLPIDTDLIAANVQARAATNAKRLGHAFSAGERKQEDAAVEQHHGAAIDAALAWADEALR